MPGCNTVRIRADRPKRRITMRFPFLGITSYRSEHSTDRRIERRKETMQQVRKIGLALTLCLSLFAAGRQEANAQGYVLIDLGTLGGSQSFADAINEEGQISGGAYLTGDTVFHPVIWDANHVIHDLGLPSGWVGGEAYSINDLGQVTGYLQNSAGIDHALYADSNGMVDLGTAGWQNSVGQGINNSGQIAGYFWNSSTSVAFL